MKINKIQVLIPGGGFFGGLESLHQLVFEAYQLGINIACVYIPCKSILNNKISYNKSLNLNDIKDSTTNKILLLIS